MRVLACVLALVLPVLAWADQAPQEHKLIVTITFPAVTLAEAAVLEEKIRALEVAQDGVINVKVEPSTVNWNHTGSGEQLIYLPHSSGR